MEQVGVSLLRALPILTSSHLRELGEAVRIRQDLPDFINFTGGTTGSLRTPVYRSTEPDERAVRRSDMRRGEGIRSLGLRSTTGMTGERGIVAGRLGMMAIPMHHRDGYEHAIQLLLRDFTYPSYSRRIKIVWLRLPTLKRLIYLMLEKGIDPEALSITTVHTWSYHLSRGWRERVQRSFPSATIETSYSFTEGRAVAYACRECGSYHYASDAIWDALDLVTGAPLAEGLGRMVLTPLRDHDTMLFRYAPGDLVIRTAPCALAGEPGFRFVGRESHTFPVHGPKGSAWPVFPVDVQEAVDTTHWVGRHHDHRYHGITRTNDDGHAKWRIRPIAGPGGQRLAVEIELQYDPVLFPDAWAQHREHVKTVLVDRSMVPDRLTGPDPAVDIVGLPPGSLSRREIFPC